MPKITRRAVLVSGGVLAGGLAVGVVGAGVLVSGYDEKALQQQAIGAKLVSEWIEIRPDGEVIVHGPHTEMGQGSQTALLQIVFDELDADPARTRYSLAPPDPAFNSSEAIMSILDEFIEPDGTMSFFVEKLVQQAAYGFGLQFTGGSMSIQGTGWRGIRRSAASARMMLLAAAADLWQVPITELRTADSAVYHDGSQRRAGYGELADAAANLPLPAEPIFKDRSEYRFIGKPYPRFDIPDKVFGQAQFGIDVAVPGMRHVAVAAPPIAKGRVTGVTNQDEVLQMRGVEQVVVLDECIAVVADNPWRAEKAAQAADIACDPPSGGVLDSAKLKAARVAAVEGVTSQLGSEGTLVEARYSTPHYAHACLEPMNCTIWEDGDEVHVATGTQGPLPARQLAATTLGRPFEKVQLHAQLMGGGFGRRNGLDPSSLNYIRIACEIHKRVGGAMKMVWSRETDMRLSVFHPADEAIMQARLGPDGKVTDWYGRVYHASQMPSEHIPKYQIGNTGVASAGGEPALTFAFWRSVAAFGAGYFNECFIDECAEAAGTDPVAYRLSMLEPGSRREKVLKRVAEMAGWKGRKVGDKGYGVAFAECFNSVVAQIAEVQIVDGKPQVDQIWCAIDCGTPVNPNSVEAQTQGAIYWAVSAALYGNTTFKDGQIEQSNFHNYRLASLQNRLRIHVDVMSTPEARVGGVGETATPLPAPAIANAMAALTERPRSLPLIG